MYASETFEMTRVMTCLQNQPAATYKIKNPALQVFIESVIA
jgi:hypothetical protein